MLFAFLLQFSSTSLGSVDGYFHIRYSALLREAGWRGFPPDFPWLPLTVLAPDRYFDHHMLFHVWLAPFTAFDLVLGAKVASALGAAAAFLAAYAFLVRWGVRRAEWWTVALLAAAPGFLYRMEMPRVQAWSVVFLLVALALLLRRRDPWLLPLAWLYTWMYDAFPLLLALCACATLADWLLERRARWQPVIHAAAGVAGALLVNPYLPHNFRFIAHHYLAKLWMSEAIPVGAEWYPLPIAEWLGWGGLLALLAGLAALLHQRRRDLDRERLIALLAGILFLCLLWRSSRFVEYFVPFATLALALCLHRRVDHRVRRLGLRQRRFAAYGIVLWLCVSTGIAVVQLRGRPSADRYAGAAQWFATHVEAAGIVFNTDWDAFPLLYFHDTAHRYVVGLDPSYLAERDLELYRLWRGIVEGTVPHPAAEMRERFGAAVAVTDHEHEAFIRAMDEDSEAVRAYADADCIVYSLAASPETQAHGGGNDTP